MKKRKYENKCRVFKTRIQKSNCSDHKNVQKIVALITKNIYNGKPATRQFHRTMLNDTDSKLHRNNLNF